MDMLFALLLAQTPFEPAALNATIEAFRTEHRIVGMNVLAMRDGKVIYQGAFGLRNRETKDPSKLDDLYRLGSVSKSLTAIAAVRMAERGDFRLDDDARRWIPELPKDFPIITARQLMSHTAGIRHYRPLGDPTARVFTQYKTAADAMKLFKEDQPIHAPGSKYSYSTHGYTYLARMMESIAKRPFDSVLRTHVFFAAAAEVDVEWQTATKPKRTALYNAPASGEATVFDRREDNSWKAAGGGMEASARGLAQIGDALLVGRLLSERGRRELWRPSKESGEDAYALGFSVAKDGTVDHSGAQQGCRAAWMLDPATKITVVALCNTSGNIPIGGLASKVMQTVRGK